MFHITITTWAITVAIILGLLALDALLLQRRPHAIRFGEAIRWSLLYIAIAVLFGVVLGVLAGWDLGTQYFAGYVVEKSLSVDNLFVFVIIINTFAVPPELQPKAITIGIALALALRVPFIALGATLLANFSFMFLLFGLLLITTAVQLYRHRNEDPSADDNVLVGIARRFLPLSPRYEQGRILIRHQGRRLFTPMLLVLLALGSTDLVFAFDSIPAVFGVTRHAYIVFAANAFALLGLRPLYFLVSGMLDRLVYLSTGLAVILAFIGAKLILEFVHMQDHSIPAIATGPSLAVIAVILAITTLASLRRTRRRPETRAHAGTLREPREQADAARAQRRSRA